MGGAENAVGMNVNGINIFRKAAVSKANSSASRNNIYVTGPARTHRGECDCCLRKENNHGWKYRSVVESRGLRTGSRHPRGSAEIKREASPREVIVHDEINGGCMMYTSRFRGFVSRLIIIRGVKSEFPYCSLESCNLLVVIGGILKFSLQSFYNSFNYDDLSGWSKSNCK